MERSYSKFTEQMQSKAWLTPSKERGRWGTDRFKHLVHLPPPIFLPPPTLKERKLQTAIRTIGYFFPLCDSAKNYPKMMICKILYTVWKEGGNLKSSLIFAEKLRRGGMEIGLWPVYAPRATLAIYFARRSLQWGYCAPRSKCLSIKYSFLLS